MEISVTNAEGSGALLCFFPDTQIIRCALLLNEGVGGKHHGELMPFAPRKSVAEVGSKSLDVKVLALIRNDPFFALRIAEVSFDACPGQREGGLWVLAFWSLNTPTWMGLRVLGH